MKHVIHENFHTKHSVLTASDEHMLYIIQLHIMSIRGERERERFSERRRDDGRTTTERKKEEEKMIRLCKKYNREGRR